MIILTMVPTSGPTSMAGHSVIVEGYLYRMCLVQRLTRCWPQMEPGRTENGTRGIFAVDDNGRECGKSIGIYSGDFVAIDCGLQPYYVVYPTILHIPYSQPRRCRRRLWMG